MSPCFRISLRMSRCLLNAALLTGLSACVVGPKYKGAPEVPLGEDWTLAGPEAAAPDAWARWWAHFNDPVLTDLIEAAQAHNPDVRLAMARIEEARYAVDLARADGLPTAALHGEVIAQRQSENGVLPVGRIPGLERDQTIHQGAVDASWELDLFGRVRRGREAALAGYEAQAADAHAARLTVAAEVALRYFQLRGAQAEARAHEAMLAALEEETRLVALRVKLGDLPEMEQTRLQSSLDAARVALPGFTGRARAAALALGTLTGGLPETYLALADDGDAGVWVLPEVPIGTRADVLRRRPDIIAGERRLAASTARVGLVMAEQFPRLGFSASGGFQALDAGDIFNAGSNTFSIGPFITWRLFDGGRLKAEIHTAESRARQAALFYEKTVVQALGEAEQALTALHTARATLAAQEQVAASRARLVDQARLRFETGDSSKLEWLTAQRVWHESREGVAQLQAGAAQAAVNAFKALGGGWNPDTDRVAEAAAP